MRRMYSEQELTTIIKAVFDQEVESGVFDEDIANYVDAYLVEHPVDPTAITGLDIAPKDVTASGNITAPSIIQLMSGYSLSAQTLPAGLTLDYVGVCQNGNKVTFVQAGHITASGQSAGAFMLDGFTIPASVGSKIFPLGETTNVDVKNILLFKEGATTQSLVAYAYTIKDSNTGLRQGILTTSSLAESGTYHFRYEVTFLLSENLVGE